MKMCVCMCANQNLLHIYYKKTWITARLKQLRQAKEEANRSGARAHYKQARHSLTKEIRVAKKPGNKLPANNPESV